MRKTLLFGTLVAILAQTSVHAGGMRGVTRIGNGRILVRQSQHTCSDNDLAFWQSVVNQAGQAGQLFLVNQTPSSPNPPGTQAGALGNAATPSSNDATLTTAEKNLDEATTNYAIASQKAATAAAVSGPNQKALQVLNAQLAPFGQVQNTGFVNPPPSQSSGVPGQPPAAGALGVAVPPASPSAVQASNVAVTQSKLAAQQANSQKLAAERAARRATAVLEASKKVQEAADAAMKAAEAAKTAADTHAKAIKEARAAALAP